MLSKNYLANSFQMTILLLLTVVSSTFCLKVMNFERSLSSPPTSPLSFTTLSSGQLEGLGDSLVLCWSQRQGAWNPAAGPFHIHGSNNQVRSTGLRTRGCKVHCNLLGPALADCKAVVLGGSGHCGHLGLFPYCKVRSKV